MKDWHAYCLYSFACVSGYIFGGLQDCFLFAVISLLIAKLFIGR